MVQERAKMEAEMDDTWGDVDDHDVSRNVSISIKIFSHFSSSSFIDEILN